MAVNVTESRLCQVIQMAHMQQATTHHAEKRGSQHPWLHAKPHVRWRRVCDQIAGRLLRQVTPREEFVGGKWYGQWYMHADGRASGWWRTLDRLAWGSQAIPSKLANPWKGSDVMVSTGKGWVVMGIRELETLHH